ncbi:MAG: type II toxin-antitoxin system Phd/YefM family antitoxin [Butyrivibrio sp.]|nr:type II toxin-antitoxin system Phd/YefM family antitoxin [Acetatifactor muris]MCM1559753.1 type II toxin-antitoxin system Phd/YefM family antitoxin [Butyrivibrio sp.]
MLFKSDITKVKAKEKIYELIHDVNINSTPVTITGSEGKNAVLIGEDDWKAIEETIYLMSIPGMSESIISGGNTSVSDCLDESEVEW